MLGDHLVGENYPRFFSCRQPPARLLATCCRNIASSAASLTSPPSYNAIVRPVLFWWPAVTRPSGSGTRPPSYRKTFTWSFVASSAQMLPSRTKYGCTVRLIVSTTSGSAACTRSRTRRQISCCHGGSASMYVSTRGSLTYVTDLSKHYVRIGPNL